MCLPSRTDMGVKVEGQLSTPNATSVIPNRCLCRVCGSIRKYIRFRLESHFHTAPSNALGQDVSWFVKEEVRNSTTLEAFGCCIRDVSLFSPVQLGTKLQSQSSCSQLNHKRFSTPELTGTSYSSSTDSAQRHWHTKFASNAATVTFFTHRQF